METVSPCLIPGYGRDAWNAREHAGHARLRQWPDGRHGPVWGDGLPRGPDADAGRHGHAGDGTAAHAGHGPNADDAAGYGSWSAPDDGPGHGAPDYEQHAHTRRRAQHQHADADGPSRENVWWSGPTFALSQPSLVHGPKETPDSDGLQPGADGNESERWRPVHDPGTLSQRASGWLPDGPSTQYGWWPRPWFLWDAARNAWPAWHKWSRWNGRRRADGEHARRPVPCQLQQFGPSPRSATAAWDATWRSGGQLWSSKWGSSWPARLPQSWLLPKSCKGGENRSAHCFPEGRRYIHHPVKLSPTVSTFTALHQPLWSKPVSCSNTNHVNTYALLQEGCQASSTLQSLATPLRRSHQMGQVNLVFHMRFSLLLCVSHPMGQVAILPLCSEFHECVPAIFFYTIISLCAGNCILAPFA